MKIDEEGNLELTAEENQTLMDQLDIPKNQYDDPPIEIEYTSMEENIAQFKATNTRTGKIAIMEFELLESND
jgi:hypothetical protein